MPIIEANILGSKIEISYKEGEKAKVENLINRFDKRLQEFRNLSDKFSDSKLIFLTALKAEDENVELEKKIKNKTNMEQSHLTQKKKDEHIREIVNLNDKLSLIEQENTKLKAENKFHIDEIEKINNNLNLIIHRIINFKNNDK